MADTYNTDDQTELERLQEGVAFLADRSFEFAKQAIGKNKQFTAQVNKHKSGDVDVNTNLPADAGRPAPLRVTYDDRSEKIFTSRNNRIGENPLSIHAEAAPVLTELARRVVFNNMISANDLRAAATTPVQTAIAEAAEMAALEKETAENAAQDVKAAFEFLAGLGVKDEMQVTADGVTGTGDYMIKLMSKARIIATATVSSDGAMMFQRPMISGDRPDYDSSLKDANFETALAETAQFLACTGEIALPETAQAKNAAEQMALETVKAALQQKAQARAAAREVVDLFARLKEQGLIAFSVQEIDTTDSSVKLAAEASSQASCVHMTVTPDGALARTRGASFTETPMQELERLQNKDVLRDAATSLQTLQDIGRDMLTTGAIAQPLADNPAAGWMELALAEGMREGLRIRAAAAEKAAPLGDGLTALAKAAGDQIKLTRPDGVPFSETAVVYKVETPKNTYELRTYANGNVVLCTKAFATPGSVMQETFKEKEIPLLIKRLTTEAVHNGYIPPPETGDALLSAIFAQEAADENAGAKLVRETINDAAATKATAEMTADLLRNEMSELRREFGKAFTCEERSAGTGTVAAFYIGDTRDNALAARVLSDATLKAGNNTVTIPQLVARLRDTAALNKQLQAPSPQ